MRRIIRLLEDAAIATGKSPEQMLSSYVARFPEEVSDSMDDLLTSIEQQAAGGSKFRWAIGKMPDGRYVSGLLGTIKRFAIPIVKQGDETHFER